MSAYNTIKDRLAPTPILAIEAESGSVRLISESEAVRLMLDETKPRLLVNASNAVRQFAKLDGVGTADREFTRQEIAKIAGFSPELMFQWHQRSILTPSVRTGRPGKGRKSDYSWVDAFVAGIVGSLRRQGLGQDVLCKVQPLFVKSKEKRTAKKGRASTRS